MSDVFCHKHNASPEDEKWKVVLEEMTNPDEGEHCEPFRGQVCPMCYMHLKDRLVEARRNLKVESREAVRYRQENDRMSRLLDVVIQTVKQFSGKDAVELAKQTYAKLPGGMPGGWEEHGNIENILPNLIAELANRKP